MANLGREPLDHGVERREDVCLGAAERTQSTARQFGLLSPQIELTDCQVVEEILLALAPGAQRARPRRSVGFEF